MIRDKCRRWCNPKRLYDYKEICRQYHFNLPGVCVRCIKECKERDIIQLDLFKL